MEQKDLPWSALLAMATAAFITILTEALPAGVLQQIGATLHVSDAWVGQLITVYALGCVVATIPLAAATRRLRRQPLLLVSMAGFVVVNTITAVSRDYWLTLCARFVAGAISGLLWSQLAGYASRISPVRLRGRAISVAMLGIPAALSLGIPAGTVLGLLVGWQYAFGVMSALSLLVMAWIFRIVPDLPGEATSARRSILQVVLIPGLPAVLLSMVFFVVAHNMLYTYIAPFVMPAGLERQVGAVLLVFGAAALLGMWITGALIDRRLRELTLFSLGLFVLASLGLGLWGSSPVMVFAAVGIWGLAFGGTPALFQTASALAAGTSADTAQSVVVTLWNAAIAAGSLFGGIALNAFGVTSFPPVLVGLLLLSIAIAYLGAARCAVPNEEGTC